MSERGRAPSILHKAQRSRHISSFEVHFLTLIFTAFVCKLDLVSLGCSFWGGGGYPRASPPPK